MFWPKTYTGGSIGLDLLHKWVISPGLTPQSCSGRRRGSKRWGCQGCAALLTGERRGGERKCWDKMTIRRCHQHSWDEGGDETGHALWPAVGFTDKSRWGRAEDRWILASGWGQTQDSSSEGISSTRRWWQESWWLQTWKTSKCSP